MTRYDYGLPCRYTLFQLHTDDEPQECTVAILIIFPSRGLRNPITKNTKTGPNETTYGKKDIARIFCNTVELFHLKRFQANIFCVICYYLWKEDYTYEYTDCTVASLWWYATDPA